MASSQAQPMNHDHVTDARDTWYTILKKKVLSSVTIKPGQRILDIACGTGQVSFLASTDVGPTGQVIGIDTSNDKFEKAISCKSRDSVRYSNVEFLKHDILDLESLNILGEKNFDLVICADERILVDDPFSSVIRWKKFIKSGGYLLVVIPHHKSLVKATAYERTLNRLGFSGGGDCSWLVSEDSLPQVLKSAGFAVERTTFIEQFGQSPRYYDIEDGITEFEKLVGDDTEKFPSDRTLQYLVQHQSTALRIYQSEWARLAVDGEIEEVNGVNVILARNILNIRLSEEDMVAIPAFIGGCRCGKVRYSASVVPSQATYCHCFTCQKLSGGPFLPFVDLKSAGVTFEHSTAHELQNVTSVATRSFCKNCGSPISMTYHGNAEDISLTMGSIDEDSVTVQLPNLDRHIMLKEKAKWYTLPEDGAKREDGISLP